MSAIRCDAAAGAEAGNYVAHTRYGSEVAMDELRQASFEVVSKAIRGPPAMILAHGRNARSQGRAGKASKGFFRVQPDTVGQQDIDECLVHQRLAIHENTVAIENHELEA
jgi:hypothetical protein